MTSIVKFVVSIGGYHGPAVTLVCVLSNEDNVLVIAEQAQQLEEERREGFGLVTNLDIQAYDYRFSDDDIRDAITNFFLRKSQDTLDLFDKLARHNPENAITKDGFDEQGPRYRFLPEITNGQLAVLAACAFCEKQSPFASAMDLMNEISDLYSVTTF